MRETKREGKKERAGDNASERTERKRGRTIFQKI